MSRGAELMYRLDRLADFTSEPGKLTRLFLTDAHKAAAEQVRDWMEAAGMRVHMDGLATMVGRYEAASPGAPVLLLGSHIDSVRDAGRYDGNLGVLAAISAIEELHGQGRRLPFTVEVLAFGDEEGVRFPTTLSGSRAIAGKFDRAALDCRDAEEVSLEDALRAFGCDPDHIEAISRVGPKTLGYVELHIEQGPVLQSEDLPVGVVTAINGASRYRIEVTGFAGHAGTVPMNLRRDALAASAQMVLAVERIAVGTKDLVATVGRHEIAPGAPNVIPGRVTFTLDIRSPSDADRELAVAEIEATFAEIARRRGVELSMTHTYCEPAITASPEITRVLEAAVEACGLRVLRLPSGAGHDAMAIGQTIPMGMLFLRCRDGISHNPAEAISEEDADVAIEVLLNLLRGLETTHEGLRGAAP